MATVYYGGPDLAPRALRDLLKARIEATPPGGEIDWGAYYFRDRDLARALVAAKARGVRVRVVMDGEPRHAGANDLVIAILREGLGGGLRLHRPPLLLPIGPNLHVKIYAFSAPRPVVLVGSFNPSGDEPEDPAIVADIGDQDRGHNLLVEFDDPETVRALKAHLARLWAKTRLSRVSAVQNRPVTVGPTTFYFFPRLHPTVVERALDGLGAGDRVHGAISHLGRGPLSRGLAQAAARGVKVELIAHDTKRRVPQKLVAGLSAAGVRIRRYVHPENLPMHAKMLITERAGERAAWFGSFNFNRGSRWLHQELLARSVDPAVVDSLEARLDVIERQAEGYLHHSSC